MLENRGVLRLPTNLLVVRELPARETRLAYRAMLELHTNMGAEAEFVDRVNRVQRPEGYRLVASFSEGERHATAVAGFRPVHTLAWGHALYCDDLAARRAFRRHGHAGALIDWLIAEAGRLGCNQFHLDSGVVRERQDAHRLFMNKRMRISAYHFELDL